MIYKLDGIIQMLLALGITIFILIGIEMNKIFLFGAGLLFLVLILYRWYLSKKLKEDIKSTIKSQWAKTSQVKRDYGRIRHLYEGRGEDTFFIDDITWKDLDMDKVHRKLDHTKSYPGREVLYYQLRRPKSEDELKSYEDKVTKIMANREIIEDIQYLLYSYGRDEFKEIGDYFKNGIKDDMVKLRRIYIYSYLMFLIPLVYFISPPLILVGVIGVASYNFKIINDFELTGDLKKFEGISSTIGFSKSFLKLDTGIFDEEKSLIREQIDIVKPIEKHINRMANYDRVPEILKLVLDYLDIITLRKVKAYYKSIITCNDLKDNIKHLYINMGTIDYYISSISYRESLDYYVRPDLQDQGISLSVEDLSHPLMDKQVPYTFILEEEGILMTGSNASGKSTFLRTVGVNNILARSMNIVLAKNYRSSYFKLMTSIGTVDSLEDGDSYFMVEAKSLNRIIQSLDDKEPVLCILDEIFRGTNTVERIGTAKNTLDYLINRNSLVMCATHDLELVDLVSSKYRNFHFEERIEGEDLKFDYILKDGPSTTTNARLILKSLGFPEEIYRE